MRNVQADPPEKQPELEAHAQALTAAAVFTTPATQPAWKTKPSWYTVARSDRIINPDLERMMPSQPSRLQLSLKMRRATRWRENDIHLLRDFDQVVVG
jgi:hypothetical protein